MGKRILYITAFMLLTAGMVSCDKKDDTSINNGTETPTTPAEPAIEEDPADFPTMGFDENGASEALFSVSDSTKIRFARGNLQYQASTGTWRFAEHQYEYIGTDNERVSSTYEGWIDLFCWGTSGWNSGAVCYQPWSTSMNNNDYLLGGFASNSLTGAYEQADWGVYNAIENGGNEAGMWRTLGQHEWSYLRSNGKCAPATIGGKYAGVVILPDDWQTPEGLTYEHSNFSNIQVTNNYTFSEWQRMEAAGAIFMPAAGRRCYGTMIADIGKCGYFWTSNSYSCQGDTRAVFYYYRTIDQYPQMAYGTRNQGFSVRLVMDQD